VYRPAAFALDDDEAWAVIDAAPLAQLVVHDTTDGLVASPVPMVRRGDSLVGHLARPNPLWRHPGDALAIFGGPDAYISPRWYEAKRDTGKVVPTWNYVTAHVHGRLVVHDDAEWVRAVVDLLTDHFELRLGTTDDGAPWATTDAPDDYLDAMARGIVGIELVELRVEGKAKLSQNRPSNDRTTVADRLADGDASARGTASAMRARTHSAG
jgi:transcriptional regulator